MNLPSKELFTIDKLIIGSFQSEEDALNVVNSYRFKAQCSKQIFMITNINNAERYMCQGDICMDHSLSEKRATMTMIDQVEMHFIENRDFDSSMEHLMLFGLSKKLALRCLIYVELGEILVIAHDELMNTDDSPYGKVHS